MATKTSGPSRKAYYARAAKEMIAIKNRRAKLTKMLKTQPNNLQIAEALKNVSYRRKIPGTTHRSKAECRAAHLMRTATTGECFIPHIKVKHMFSIQERVRVVAS